MNKPTISPCYDCKHHGEEICTHDERCPFGFAEWRKQLDEYKAMERESKEYDFIAYEVARDKRIKKYTGKRG